MSNPIVATSLLIVSTALTACAPTPHRPEFSGGIPMEDCPDHLRNQVRLLVEVRPVEMSADAMSQPAIATTGSLGRHVAVSVIPSGLRADDRIVWSSLAISSYGGTFLGWDDLRLNTRADEPAARPTQGEEMNSVTFSPGQLKVLRTARGKKNLSGTVALNVLVMPGGAVVDDTVVRIPKLWRDDGTPLSAKELAPELIPFRHPPGLDIVEGEFELAYVVREGATGDEWSCAVEAKTTLVDRASLRQPFWDLGLASRNSSRREWLALFDPSLGAVRLVFDNPAGAHSLASWLRATRSAQVGPFTLTAFRQSSHVPTRPFGPVSEDVMRDVRPLAAEDFAAIAIGPAGEP